jgi:hypothetical protein
MSKQLITAGVMVLALLSEGCRRSAEQRQESPLAPKEGASVGLSREAAALVGSWTGVCESFKFGEVVMYVELNLEVRQDLSYIALGSLFADDACKIPATYEAMVPIFIDHISDSEVSQDSSRLIKELLLEGESAEMRERLGEEEYQKVKTGIEKGFADIKSVLENPGGYSGSLKVGKRLDNGSTEIDITVDKMLANATTEREDQTDIPKGQIDYKTFLIENKTLYFSVDTCQPGDLKEGTCDELVGHTAAARTTEIDREKPLTKN